MVKFLLYFCWRFQHCSAKTVSGRDYQRKSARAALHRVCMARTQKHSRRKYERKCQKSAGFEEEMRTSVKAIENKTLLANLRSPHAPSSQLFTSAAPKQTLLLKSKVKEKKKSESETDFTLLLLKEVRKAHRKPFLPCWKWTWLLRECRTSIWANLRTRALHSSKAKESLGADSRVNFSFRCRSSSLQKQLHGILVLLLTASSYKLASHTPSWTNLWERSSKDVCIIS